MSLDSTPPFVHLRVKSAYSLAEGAIRVKDLVKISAGLDMPAVALTDRGNLFGALEFAVTASKAGLQPVIGAVLGIHRHSDEPGADMADPDHLLLLASDSIMPAAGPMGLDLHLGLGSAYLAASFPLSTGFARFDPFFTPPPAKSMVIASTLWPRPRE